VDTVDFIEHDSEQGDPVAAQNPGVEFEMEYCKLTNILRSMKRVLIAFSAGWTAPCDHKDFRPGSRLGARQTSRGHRPAGDPAAGSAETVGRTLVQPGRGLF